MTIPSAPGKPVLLSPDTSTVVPVAAYTIARPGPHTRAAVAGLVVATLAIGLAYASALLALGADGRAPTWAPWLMATGVPLALVSVMTLGAARGGRVPGVLLAAFAFVGMLLAAGFALALALPGSAGTAAAGTAGEPLLLGLPRRAAIIVYGIGLLPVLVLPMAYAMTFEASTLRDEDLERVVALGRAAAARRDAERQDAAKGDAARAVSR